MSTGMFSVPSFDDDDNDEKTQTESAPATATEESTNKPVDNDPQASVDAMAELEMSQEVRAVIESGLSAANDESSSSSSDENKSSSSGASSKSSGQANADEDDDDAIPDASIFSKPPPANAVAARSTASMPKYPRCFACGERHDFGECIKDQKKNRR